MRSVARHSPQLAQAVVNSGATQSLVNCLEEFDPSVKESAAWALGYIARHNGDLAQSVVDAGAIPLFALCLQEPELPLKRIAASALSDIAKHSPDLAQAVVDSGCIPLLASFLHIHRNQINSVDPKLQRQAINCLANVAKHTLSLAEAVVDGEIVPGVYACFKGDSGLKRHAATLVCEIVKHSVELGQLVANSGGIPALVEYVSSSRGGNKVPGVMALGYLAGMNEVLAMSVVVSKGVPVLVNCLNTSNGALEDYGSHVADDKTAASSAHAYGGDDEKEIAVEYVKAASCWALGQIGKHSPEHAKSLNAHAVLPKLLAVLNSVQPLSSVSPNAALDDNNEKEEAAEDDLAADLRLKAKRALKAILGNTLEASALEPVLQKITPPNILKYVISQYAKILPSDIAARRAFVISGGLARVQEIAAIYAVGPVSSLSAQQQQPQAQPAKKAGVTVVGTQQDSFLGSKLAESIRTINECYPEEIVRYYSPGYSNTLLAKLDSYTSAGGQSQNPVITRTAFDGAENGGKEEQPNAAAGAQ